ncbi:TldD/PmbA family protein [Mucilaginibacter sp. KACC 22063]|uniref:TldD/PmbA family protein n=1 Tax=Mucilaginibacter sp. KACC 22063 TaxID=3025666 RepID=UPI0023653FD3|nr:TldD/PmbA family protein [Mucilaginibacter sp. KACC 22063]WDF54557.1 TldD/PmbA family protein [Mucilaginibacter sp. KACC 22063]
MAILSQEEAQALMKKALSYSKADECEINFSGSNSGNIRYARNSVSTSGAVSTTSMVISSAFGKKLGVVTLNEYDDKSIETAVRRSEELAQLAPENPEYMPFLGPQTYGPTNPKLYDQKTAEMTPKQRADMVEASLNVAKESKLTAAGFLQNTGSFSAMMNSHGLFAYNKYSDINFSITMRTPDSLGSGYATKDYEDFNDMDTLKLTKIAAQKASGSVTAKAIEPGKYTVILEPAAGIVLLENLYGSLDARSADEGRSFLSKAGGGTRLGEKLVDERVNIYSDPADPRLPTSTWSGDGQPQQKVNWIEKGVIKNLYYSRYWAQKKGVKPMPGPGGVIMEGGEGSIEDLIKSTEKGILVTRLWYIREVDPQTLLYTGLTRDGTFYIENGQIKFPVKNFRFNESPVIMLNNLEALGKPERTVSGESFQSALIPPMKIRDFTFSSLSDAV